MKQENFMTLDSGKFFLYIIHKVRFTKEQIHKLNFIKIKKPLFFIKN